MPGYRQYVSGYREDRGRNGMLDGDTEMSTPCRWYRHVVLAGRECCGLSSIPLFVPRSQNSQLRLFFTNVGDNSSTNFT